jgi:hypothetical protein
MAASCYGVVDARAANAATSCRRLAGRAANYTQLLLCEFNEPRRIAGQLRKLGLAQAEAEVFVLLRTNGFLIRHLPSPLSSGRLGEGLKLADRRSYLGVVEFRSGALQHPWL